MTITRCLSELCYISCATWLTVKNWPGTPLITIIFSSQSCDPIGQRHGSRKRACALYPGSSQSSSVSLAKSIPALARYEKGIKNGLGSLTVQLLGTFRASLDQSGTSSKTKTLAWDGRAHRPHWSACDHAKKSRVTLRWRGRVGETPVFTKRFYEFIPGEGSFCPSKCFFGLAKRRARNPHTAKVERRGRRESDIRLKVLDLFELCRNCCFETAETQLLELHFMGGPGTPGHRSKLTLTYFD